MAFDAVIDKKLLESALTASANAIREKTGGTEPIAWLPDKGFAEAIGAIETGGGGSADEEWFHDGNTHVWVSLQEGRTSPMLGVCPNGTVTVDWGDGTTPDVLTGTSTSTVKWTPTHNYASAGVYVITLTVDGEMGFYGTVRTNEGSGILRYSSGAAARNQVYKSSVHKVEIGNGINSIKQQAFRDCYSLTSISIPDSVTSIGESAFASCHSLASIVIPDSVTFIGSKAFYLCYSLSSVSIPDSVTSIGVSAFESCRSLASIELPKGVTAIAESLAESCESLASVVVRGSVGNISGGAFKYNAGVKYYDFTACTVVPTLASTDAFSSRPADCEIRVPAVLYDEWIAETNWTTYASCIKAKEGIT